MLCDDELKASITANLAAFDVIENKVDDAHHAAVAITVTDAAHGARTFRVLRVPKPGVLRRR